MPNAELDMQGLEVGKHNIEKESSRVGRCKVFAENMFIRKIISSIWSW